MCPGTLKITAEQEIKAEKSLKSTIHNFREIVTVEPLIACYQMALFISKPALDNLEFEKSCRVNLGYNTTICDAILSGNHGNYIIENDKVQTIISTVHSWQQPIQSFTPLVLILFLGSFSDRHKWRKPFLLIPIVGELFGVAGCVFCTIPMYRFPLEAQGIFQKIIPSLFGGQTMLVMATTAYIADISSVEMRTLRLGVVQIVISIVLPIVQSVSGIFFVKTGYIRVLSSAAILNCIALTYGVFCIKEPEKYRPNEFNRHILVDIFNPQHAKDTFNLLLKKTLYNDRTFIWLLVLMTFLHRSAFDGESNVLYLYTQNIFQWTPLEYSYFLTANSLVALAGHLLGVPLFTKVLYLSDLTILLITTMDKIVTNIFFGLAQNVVIFYAGLVVSIITRVYRTAKKSLATKIVPKNDIGKAQSLLGICDVLAPAVFVPVYNKLIYLNTLHYFPAAFFFFSVLLYIICCILIILMYLRIRKKMNKIETNKSENGSNTASSDGNKVMESIINNICDISLK